MLVMQYLFALPADYPMGTIRDRIAARGPQFDTLPGLGWKAFLVRERGIAGATDHQYAPLYLWPSAEAGAQFLAGPLFAGVCGAFGRPRVSTALVVGHRAPGAAPSPRWCTSEHTQLRSLADLQERLSRHGDEAGAHSDWLALDASRWVLSRHRLWSGDEPPTVDGATLFEVAHFSRPA